MTISEKGPNRIKIGAFIIEGGKITMSTFPPTHRIFKHSSSREDGREENKRT